MLVYIGNGDFIPGIPARDLSEEEVATLGRELLLSSGLYVEKAGKPKPSSNKLINIGDSIHTKDSIKGDK